MAAIEGDEEAINTPDGSNIDTQHELNPNQKCYLNYCIIQCDLPTSFCGGSNALQKNMQLIVVIIGLIMEKQKVDKEIDDCIGQGNISRCYLGCVIMNKIVIYRFFCGGSTCTTEEHANACRNHWINYGRAEGRAGNPDNCFNDDNIGVLTPFIWGKAKSHHRSYSLVAHTIG